MAAIRHEPSQLDRRAKTEVKKPIFKTTNLKAKEFAEDMAEKLRAQMERMKPEPDQIYQIHHNMRRMTNQFDAPGPDMRRVIDFNVPAPDEDVPVRLYVPHQASEEAGPCLLYLHGGGFVTCSVESHEGITRRIASGSGYRVL
jgi:acetyl esterase